MANTLNRNDPKVNLPSHVFETSRGSEASVVACGGGVRHLNFKVASTAVALGGAEAVDGAVARGPASAEHGVGYYFASAGARSVAERRDAQFGAAARGGPRWLGGTSSRRAWRAWRRVARLRSAEHRSVTVTVTVLRGEAIAPG